MFLHLIPNPIKPVVPEHGVIQPTHLAAKQIKASTFNNAGLAQYVIYILIISSPKIIASYQDKQ